MVGKVNHIMRDFRYMSHVDDKGTMDLYKTCRKLCYNFAKRDTFRICIGGCNDIYIMTATDKAYNVTIRKERKISLMLI